LLLQQIRSGGSDEDKLRELLSTAQRLGLADTPVAALSASKQ
jgi:hypothetical protein